MHPDLKIIKQVDVLTIKILDELHSDDDVEQLSVLLSNSKEARARYSELTLQDSLLHWETAAEEVEFTDVAQRGSILNFPIISSVAASIVALFGVWWIHTKVSDPVDSDVNTLISHNTADTSFLNEGSIDKNENYIDERKGFDLSTNSFNISSSSLWAYSARAHNDALYGINILKDNKNFGDGGIVEFNGDFASWKRAEHLSVPTENGILPKIGKQMIKLSSMDVDVTANKAEVSETIQVLDVRSLNSGSKNLSAKLQTSIFFNKGVNFAESSSEFSLSLHAIASNEKQAIGHQANSLDSDLNPSTWEKINTDFTIPAGTEFVVVSVSARKQGPDSLLPDIGGHYADGLSINLLIDGQNTIGPL
jgi:hypothetical protein